MNQATKTTLTIIILAVVAGGYVWYAQRPAPETPPTDGVNGQVVDNSDGLLGDEGRIDTSDWETYTYSDFSFKYPKNWTCRESKDYSGQVVKELCGITYGENTGAFDDGLDVSFGFVTNQIASTYKWAGKLWSETGITGVKDQSNSEEYENSNFTGWISMKNPTHTLRLIARHKVGDGYYEVEAYAMGDTKTDGEYKKIVDQIITTFETKQ